MGERSTPRATPSTTPQSAQGQAYGEISLVDGSANTNQQLVPRSLKIHQETPDTISLAYSYYGGQNSTLYAITITQFSGPTTSIYYEAATINGGGARSYARYGRGPLPGALDIRIDPIARKVHLDNVELLLALHDGYVSRPPSALTVTGTLNTVLKKNFFMRLSVARQATIFGYPDLSVFETSKLACFE